jgi:hypothetical protein
MTFAPTYLWASDTFTWGDRTIDPFWWSFLLVPIGALVVIVSLHVIDALARSCARWAVWSVCRRVAPSRELRAASPEQLELR